MALPGGDHAGRALHRDRGGRLWLSTGSDIARLSPGPIRFLGPAVGFGGRQLFQMIDDDRGGFWVSTSRGLLRLPADRMIALADGLPASIDPLSLETDDRRRDIIANNTRDPSVWKDRGGRLWFATDQGALTVDPARLRVNERPPAVRIDEATADARPLAARRRQPAAARPGKPGLSLLGRDPAGAPQEPAPLPAGGLRAGLGGGGRAPGGLLHQHPAGPLPLPGPGQQRRRRVERGRATPSSCGSGRTSIERPGSTAASALALVAALGLLWRQRVRGLRRGYLAALAERGRVARELHDTLLQGMSAVGIQVRGLRRRLGDEAPALARELSAIDTLVTATLQETRAFLGNLRGQDGSGDLAMALERLAGRLTGSRDIACAVVVEGPPEALADQVKGDLFRIAQEAIHNAVKHADPRRIEVKLRYQPGVGGVDGVRRRLRLLPRRQRAGAAEGHFGLLGMRERAARLGDFRLATAPGQGTTVRDLGAAAEQSGVSGG